MALNCQGILQVYWLQLGKGLSQVFEVIPRGRCFKKTAQKKKKKKKKIEEKVNNLQLSAFGFVFDEKKLKLTLNCRCLSPVFYRLMKPAN